ncbi:phosphatase PAP2 family protein [Acinetobacter sp. VT 511]|uniref:phosphatase PAP2 family protein n=1 Tax=Acinetobacter sp. VT 511 TaxID=1675902 RepID=UPI001BB2EABC|nr:phosphatase PAP2 family protein [Acinetobacter sp. VT 511]
MHLFTWIGSEMPVVFITIIAMIVLYVCLRHKRELLFLACVLAGSTLLNALLKLVFQRARPTINRIIEVSGYSFPSGHSMAAFSLYGGLAFLIWKHVPTVTGRVLLIVASAVFILTIGCFISALLIKSVIACTAVWSPVCSIASRSGSRGLAISFG